MNAPCSRTASIRRTGGQCLFAQPGGFGSGVGVAGGVADGVIAGPAAPVAVAPAGTARGQISVQNTAICTLAGHPAAAS